MQNGSFYNNICLITVLVLLMHKYLQYFEKKAYYNYYTYAG